jgi:hypothetical protein
MLLSRKLARTLTRVLTPALALAALLPAAHAAVEPAAIVVQDIHPENFTDLGDSRNPGPQVRAAYLESLNRHLQERAARALTPGETLQVEISDVDMAGEFEGWHLYADNVRMIRDIYPPRIDLHFILVDAAGSIVKDGDRKLRDTAFTRNVTAYSGDPLRYEKALIDAWVDHEFAPR